jgi:branched-chain amino acid transport system substrate-binding protein
MTYRLKTILMVLLFLLPSCIMPEDPAKEREERAKQARGDILVGAVGPWSAIDNMLWEGIAMAVDEINHSGGLLGRKIRVLKRDDESTVKKGILIAQEFGENPDLVAVVGHYESFITMPASVVYQYCGLLMLSTVDTNPGLTRQGFPLVFRTVPNDIEYGKKLADFCRQKGFNQLLVMLQRSEYGRDFSDAFATVAQSAALHILDGASYDRMTSAKELQGILKLWKERYSFDAILLSGELPRSAAIIREARLMGIKQPIIGGIAMDQKRILTLVGKETKDVFLPTNFYPHSKSTEVLEFVKNFQKRYGRMPDGMAAQGYDTIQALAYAIKKAGSTVPSEMAKALRSADNLRGATGNMWFSKDGDRVMDKIFIKMVEDGQFNYLNPGS